MAEHLRHELARAGHPIRPSAILTLSQFVDLLCPQPRAASPSVLTLHVADALDRLRPAEFAGVASYPGFRRALTSAISEIGSSGTAVGRLLVGRLPGAYGNAITRVFERVEQTLASCAFALRYRRLAVAGANWVDDAEVFLDGFYSLNSSELQLLKMIGERSALTVALPDSPDTAVRESLLARGFEEQRFPVPHRHPTSAVFAAPTMAQEVNEIARRVLQAVDAGRSFRDIGIILRSSQPYESALRVAFARFGIPFRSYFVEPVAHNAAARAILGIARAVASGLDYEELLPAVRLASFGMLNPQGDAAGFALEEQTPGRGLEGLADPHFASVRDMAAAAAGEARTAQGWSSLLATVLPAFAAMDRISHQAVHRIRAQQAAVETLVGLSEEIGEFVPRPMPFDHYVRLLTDAAEQSPLRVPDDRRNVVHILDVFEARQWELRVVFVCGMLERRFPQYHAPDSLLSDAARAELGLPTSAGQQQQERLLFEIAGSRATTETTFSYPRFNDKGDDHIPSFFLRGMDVERVDSRVRPVPGVLNTQPIEGGTPLDAFLATRHKRFSASSLERFLQCPFQFFGDRTLKLGKRPKAPNDRLDVLVQGSIMHELLARVIETPPLFRDGLFDQIFAEACLKARVPDNYRREAIRLELHRHFERFLDNRDIALGWTIETEKKFDLMLGQIAISGRIDRLDIGPRKQTLVVDYKYSGAEAIKNAASQTEDGTRLQAGLYMLAAERALGLKPVGMMYCGLRKDVTWSGWHALSPEDAAHVTMKDVERVRPEDLRDVMDRAAEYTLDAVSRVLSGSIAPQPADRDKCKWCDYRDICRIETEAQFVEITAVAS